MGPRAWWLGLVAFASTGCGAKAFSLSFPDNQPQAVAKAMNRVDRGKLSPRNGKPTVYLVTADPQQLVAYALDEDRILWKRKASVASRIAVGRGRIFHATDKGRGLVGRSASDGQLLWKVSLDSDVRLLGLTSDGTDLYYAVEAVEGGAGSGTYAQLVAIAGDSGKERWRRGSAGRLGAPAARGGLVFVPSRYQSIALLDANDGVEIARVRSKQEALLWARATPRGVFFGGKTGVYRLDRKATSGTRQESTFVTASLPKSVRPVYWWDSYNAALAGYTAYDRNRLLWRLAPGEPHFANDTIFVHAYRFFFAFDTEKAERSLRWAYSFPREDVVASTYSGGALVFVSERGDIVVLDPEVGLPVRKKALELGKVRGASFDVAGYEPKGKPKGEADLQKTLTQMIWDPDRRFEAVKLFCVEQLAKLSGDKVAEALVQIVTKSGLNPKVYARAGDMIVGRHDKSAIPLYVKTLRSHYSFVEGTHAKAVDIMARALGDLKAAEAVRPLLMHLADHETSMKAIVAIARALRAIGSRRTVEPLRDFLLTYRCDPAFKKKPDALKIIAETLLDLGTEDERQLLRFVANDAHSVAPLRTFVTAALRKAQQGAAGKQAAKAAKPQGGKPKARRPAKKEAKGSDKAKHGKKAEGGKASAVSAPAAGHHR